MQTVIRPFLMMSLVAVLTGGHVALLQSVAWAGMLATRTQTQGWSQAVESTFSGKAPCRMCLVAQALDDQDWTDDRGPEKPGPKATRKCDLMVHLDLVWPIQGDDHPLVPSVEPTMVRALDVQAPEPPPPRSVRV